METQLVFQSAWKGSYISELILFVKPMDQHSTLITTNAPRDKMTTWHSWSDDLQRTNLRLQSEILTHDLQIWINHRVQKTKSLVTVGDSSRKQKNGGWRVWVGRFELPRKGEQTREGRHRRKKHNILFWLTIIGLSTHRHCGMLPDCSDFLLLPSDVNVRHTHVPVVAVKHLQGRASLRSMEEHGIGKHPIGSAFFKRYLEIQKKKIKIHVSISKVSLVPRICHPWLYWKYPALEFIGLILNLNNLIK